MRRNSCPSVCADSQRLRSAELLSQIFCGIPGGAAERKRPITVLAHAEDVCRVEEGCECDMVVDALRDVLLMFPQAASQSAEGWLRPATIQMDLLRSADLNRRI